MGITNINEVVKNRCERAFVNVRVVNLKNKRLGIDAALWLCTNIAVAQREKVRRMTDLFEEIDRGELMQHCITAAIKFCCYLLEKEIYPVWIEDGESPAEKKQTRVKRKKVRDDRGEKIQELKNELSKQDILCRNPTKMDELRKLMMYDVQFFAEEYKMFYRVLSDIGIPVITAPGEAEAYACSLNRRGIIYGIWTTDTDCYALGGINMITGMGSPDSDGFETFEVVHIPYIRKSLQFDEDEMRDFCIMCGNDFNLNIPNLGSERAYNAIEEHRNIEAFIANEVKKEEVSKGKKKPYKSKDTQILNHERSRELLSVPDCDLNIDSVELNLNLSNFKQNKKNIIDLYELSQFYPKLNYYFNRDITISLYESHLGPHNRKKKISLIVDGQTKISKQKVIKTIKYDSNIHNMADLIKNLPKLE